MSKPIERSKAFSLLYDICDGDRKDSLYAHSIDVAKRCSIEAKPAAFLHDIVEDTSFTVEQIASLVSPEVAASVDLLTRRETETYFEYIYRIIDVKDPIAIEVKIADLEDHLAKTATLSDSLKKRYELALRLLIDLGGR